MSCFRIDLLILSAIRTIHLCTKTNIDSTPFIEFSRCEENRLHVSCIIHILLSFVYENSSKIHKLLIFSLMCIPLNCNQTYYIDKKSIFAIFSYISHNCEFVQFSMAAALEYGINKTRRYRLSSCNFTTFLQSMTHKLVSFHF